MASAADTRSWGTAFDRVAEDYDRHRPAYPDRLIDHACAWAGLGPGDRVLEIGCGTGQLTQSLVARGLRLTAVEPGERLIARARERLAGLGEVEFINARFEDALVPVGRFRAAFSASAIHWVDPESGWRRLADALSDGGSLALLSFFGLDDPYSRVDQAGLRAARRRVVPQTLGQWPNYRDLETLEAGASARRDNISEVWAWLGGYEVARGHAADLFQAAELTAMPLRLEQSADQLNALLGTMSFWGRLTPRQRAELADETHRLQRRLGRPIRSSTAACLVMARRRRSAHGQAPPVR